MIADSEVTEDHTEDKDLVVAIGGDSTYLDVASKVTNPSRTAYLGINSVGEKERLCDAKVSSEDHVKQIQMIAECLNRAGAEDEDDYIEYFYRSRMSMQTRQYQSVAQHRTETEAQPDTSGIYDKTHFVLNEVMISEKDASMLSVYRLKVDDVELGKFRSSGVLIATGTGSTGWLYSARQLNARQITNLKRIIGLQRATDEDIELYEYRLAQKISQETVFPADSDSMYYFVREGF